MGSIGLGTRGSRRGLLFLLLLTTAVQAATGSDTLRHVGYTRHAGPAWQIATDAYERKWLRDRQAFSVGFEVNRHTLPADSDAFARDYGYPTLSLGAEFNLNHGVTMHRTADPAWGKAQMVDYDSHLGDIISVYGAFERPLWRSRRWQLAYLLRAGIGYGPHKYNRHNNIDNELIGSRYTIYIGGGLTATWQFSRDWALQAGLLYGHHSNGALNRPNKGENHVGPLVGVRYAPSHQAAAPASVPAAQPFTPYWYANLRLGVGGKTLLEDWQLTQFGTDPEAPRYRTDKFRFYMAYSAQVDLMWRYARRWASGIGADISYGTYADRVRDLDEAAGRSLPHSPWSFGLGLRHEAYYHRLSLDMALGVYLYRHMGASAKEIEKPYYERIGIFYTIPRLHHLRVGCSVKAHLTKADLTEIVISLPFRLFLSDK